MADFIYVDKENATSQVNFMSRPQHGTTNRGIVGKAFQSGPSRSQRVRKVFGDVNRESTARGKTSDMLAKSMAGQNQKQMMYKKPWKILQPAAPASKPSKSKDKSPSAQENKEQTVKAVVTETVPEDLVEDIEEMHIAPDEPDTYADIWAVDYPIIPDMTEEDSSDEDSLLSDSEDEFPQVIRDYDLEEPENCEVELTLETMPSIEDIPLPPLEDLIPDTIDLYSSLS